VWLAVGYLTILLMWSLFHPDGVQRIQAQLDSSCTYRPAATTSSRRWVKRACYGR
jgi:hypothetical protein